MIDAAPAATAPLRAWLPGFLALALIWGSSFWFIKVGVGELHPLHVTLGRVAAGTVTLLAVLVVTRTPLPQDPRLWAHLAFVAAIGVALPFALFAYGEQRISSSVAGIWNATTPLVVLPLAVLLFRTEPMRWRKATGLVLGFAGVLTILGVWRGVGGAELTGQLMCFGAAACYGLAIPYFKRFVAGRAESGLALSTVQVLLATVILAVVAPIVAGPPPAPTALSLDVISAVAALGALGTGIAFVIHTRNIRLAGATTASMVTYLVPVVATVVGVTILTERLEWNQPVGALVVLGGVAVSQGLVRRPRLRSGLPTAARDEAATPTPTSTPKSTSPPTPGVACDAAAACPGRPPAR